ncbi:MAG: MerR family transcriptional regulator [Ktedonobacteraceae bacterium]
MYNKSMQESEQRFTLEELAELVQLPVRTIRYYIAEDLLPGPGARGKAATYGEEHLLRLNLIRRLSEQHLPLAEMQALLAGLSLVEIRALVAEKRQMDERARPDQSVTPKEYVEKLLKRARQGVSSSEILPPSRPGNVPASTSSTLPAPAGTTWHHWELAPGVELHIRSDADYQQRALREQLFKVVGLIFKPSHRKS